MSFFRQRSIIIKSNTLNIAILKNELFVKVNNSAIFKYESLKIKKETI